MLYSLSSPREGQGGHHEEDERLEARALPNAGNFLK